MLMLQPFFVPISSFPQASHWYVGYSRWIKSMDFEVVLCLEVGFHSVTESTALETQL